MWSWRRLVLTCEVGVPMGVLAVTEGVPTGSSRVRVSGSTGLTVRTTSGPDKWVNVVLVTMGGSSAGSVGLVV